MPRPDVAEEAILLASSDAAVADYLVKRGTNTNRRVDFAVSEKAESTLLQRGDRLVDLRLAEYGRFPSTARTLFFRDPDDWALRSLVLSNQAVADNLFLASFPECLFQGEDGLL